MALECRRGRAGSLLGSPLAGEKGSAGEIWGTRSGMRTPGVQVCVWGGVRVEGAAAFQEPSGEVGTVTTQG